jgi:hypothetical protein
LNVAKKSIGQTIKRIVSTTAIINGHPAMKAVLMAIRCALLSGGAGAPGVGVISESIAISPGAVVVGGDQVFNEAI